MEPALNAAFQHSMQEAEGAEAHITYFHVPIMVSNAIYLLFEYILPTTISLYIDLYILLGDGMNNFNNE